MDELTGERLGNYRLLEIIGQGGMSTVYKAVDESDDSLVAVKLLSSYIAQEPRFKARFAREIEMLKSLSGGKIVPILGYGEGEAFTYIVMPFLARGTLHERMENGGVSLSETGRILNDVSDALKLAHSRGIVHRDVKPSNILLDEAGGAYLSDFGFAYVSENSHSLTGSVLIGTPAFMSPEQCRGEEVDTRSDQYSLGAVLFLLTTGRLPFQADTPMAMVVKHIHDPLQRPRSVNPYLPDAIEAVILRAMAKGPQDRFESVEAMNRAYQEALARSLDPESGLPIPEAVGPVPVTAAMPAVPLPLSTGSTPLWAKGRAVLALAVVAMFAIPLAAWALTGRTPGGANGTATPSDDLLATVQALSTENALILGAAVGPEQIQTAVAATVAAMGPDGSRVTALAALPSTTPTPSPTPTLGTLRAGTAVPGQADGGDGSGSGGSGPGPTNTAAPSTPVPPTSVPDTSVPPTSAPTDSPTSVPPPPNPSVPPPTEQPTDHPTPDKCNDNNPNKHCTPTP